MNERADWNTLQHVDRLKIMRETALDQIVADYRPADEDERSFRTRVGREILLWQPQHADPAAKEAGAPPNKEVVLGAWRDLDRSEALLELIDNSIDAEPQANTLPEQIGARTQYLH